VPGLGTTLGRGGATTAPGDLVNSQAILIMGSNMAENHPVGFQWVIEARERGAHVIHVDPRFSRTSAMATMWAPLRAGSDVLFLGGLINYALDRGKVFRASRWGRSLRGDDLDVPACGVDDGAGVCGAGRLGLAERW